jgi:hypothetical protein
MSRWFMHVFPVDPLQPNPDWPSLRAELLRRRFMLEPRGGDVPVPTVRELWHSIKQDRQLRDLPYPEGMHGLEGLMRALQAAGIVDRDIRFDLDDMSVPEFVAALRSRSFVSPRFVFDHTEEFKPGPLYEALSDEPSEFILRTVSYDDSGDQIIVFCGTNTPRAPGIPGTDRVFEDWIPFVDRWTKNPREKWIDPETGRGYGLLDLDWGDTLGAGRCALTISHPGYLNPLKTAELVADITGQPFRASYCHL